MNPHPIRAAATARDHPWKTFFPHVDTFPIVFGLAEIVFGFRDCFWPCDNVSGLTEIVIGLAISFLAL